MKIDFTPILQRSWVAAGVGIGTLVYGEIKKGQANKQASALQASRPQLTPSPYTADELALSKSELANGMGADASRYYQESQDRNLSNSLDALLKGGGSVNNVAQIFDGSQQGNQRLTLMKENLRLNNINNFMAASRNADTERQQEFQFNQWSPWADKSQANSLAKQSANQTINSGLNTAGSAIASGVGNLETGAAYNNYFQSPSSDTTLSPSSASSAVSGGAGGINVAGSISGQPQPLNLNLNNSSNQDIWNIPGKS
jgi:hypothetical protein